jgi:hypothetical protein
MDSLSVDSVEEAAHKLWDRYKKDATQ